ncbi:MAG: hypothetical protein LQ340_002442 [Diploschistes diacapsis]|nr:MAG: hypothetical protein LQ340_002442 [Diploschistes diacapsis]
MPAIVKYALLATLIASATANSAINRDSYVYRDGTKLKIDGQHFTTSGANVYWLGLDENVIPPKGQPFYAPFNASYPTFGRITEIMNTLNTMGANVIRSQTLGVSVGNPLSVMPSLGVVNQQAFKSIDWAVYQAREHGLRIFAPLIDNYDYYHGGKYDFLRFRGINISSTASPVSPLVQQFYTNATIISDFKNYIHALLTHRNPYTNLTYAEDPTIFAYETGNELGGPIFGDMDVPISWTTEISAYVKQLAPKKLVVDGTYGINKNHLPIQTIDIVSDHYYPRNLTKLDADIALAGSAGKPYIVGEYAWNDYNYGNPPSGPPLAEFLAAIQARQNMTDPVVTGDLFWSLFMHDVPNCNIYVNHSDGFALQYGNPLNTPTNNSDIATIRQHLFAMRAFWPFALLPTPSCFPLPHQVHPVFQMCTQYLFHYSECGCRKTLWDERFPCRYSACCGVLLTRDVAMEGMCAECRLGREEMRRRLREMVGE